MEKTNTRKGTLKEIYTKAILMGVALLLLVAALVFFTVAWYTKMVSTAGINLQAAQWDFTANHTVDAVTVNVYEYSSLSDEKAAPGTAGYIPIVLGARQSDTDIQYTLLVDRTTMSPEFQDRIFFYYNKEEGGTTKKVYFGASPEDPDNDKLVEMTGTIPHGGTATVTIYWEWIYEAPEGSDSDAWDEFDTKVGEDPALYITDMNAKVTVVGVEVNPKTTQQTP